MVSDAMTNSKSYMTHGQACDSGFELHISEFEYSNLATDPNTREVGWSLV